MLNYVLLNLYLAILLYGNFFNQGFGIDNNIDHNFKDELSLELN